MHEQEKLYEQYEDAVFALLMDKVAEENGKKLLQQNEELLAGSQSVGQTVEHFHKQILLRYAKQIVRNCAHSEFFSSERLNLKSDSCEPVHMRIQHFRFLHGKGGF